MRQRRVDHTETSSTPSERCRTLAKGGQKQISSPSALTPVVATQTWVGWAPTPPPPLDAATTDHSRKAHRAPASTTESLQSRNLDDHWKLGLVPTSRFRIIVAAMWGVAFPHHVQTVSPTGKMGCCAHPVGTCKPQTTARERQGSKDLRIHWSRKRSEDGAKTPPHSAVVADCKLLCQIWSDGPQQEVGSGGPTHEEEEVGGLRVVDPWDPVEEGGMLSTFLHEELLDELRLTCWNTQHPQSLLGVAGGVDLPSRQRHLASPFWLPW